MKRYHKIKLADTELTLSLSFKTSMEINDNIASPTFIVTEILELLTRGESGEKYVPGFVLNERNAVQILTIANAPHENLGFDAIGELAAEQGFMTTFRLIFIYLQQLVIGRADEPAKKSEGGSGN